MRFQCPFCLFIITADDSFLGDSQRPRINCPNCSKTVFIPTKRFEEGYVIADFAIIRKLGEGSIGAVYEATQISLNRQVALKVLFEEYTNAKGINDFIKEARAIAALSHPNLVQCYAVGEEGGVCYMAMDYIKGQSVKTKLRKEGRIQLDEALHVVQQVSEALYYAWDEAKLIHRDVKPDNIMVNDEGVVKLTDLGLAMHHTDWQEDMEISGSPSYMSPEQFAGEKLDTRCDIYSLGVTLYQMLSGHLPFEGETVKTIAKQHFHEDAISLTKLDSKIPPKVSQLVSKMIAKYADERFQSMEDLLNAIWLIRQRTAPDKSLIPDVHTISMKRLDYELQKETVRRQEHVSRTITSLAMRVALVALPVILIIVGSIIAVSYSKANKFSKKRDKVEAIGRHLRAGDIELDMLLKRTHDLLAKYQTPQTPLEHELKAKLQFYLSQINNRKLQSRFNNLSKDLTHTKVKLNQQLEQLNLKQKNQSRKAAKLKNEKQSYEKKIAQLQKQLNSLKTKQHKITSILKATTTEKQELYRNTIRLRLYNLIKRAKFKKAQFYLKHEAVSSKEPAWLDYYMALLKRLSYTHDILTESDALCAGTELDSYGKIVAISDGMIQYRSNSMAIKEKSWDTLPLDTLTNVVRKVDELERSPKQLQADIALLLGKTQKAQSLLPIDKELQALHEAQKEVFSDAALSRKKRKSKSSSKPTDRIGTSSKSGLRPEIPTLPED